MIGAITLASNKLKEECKTINTMANVLDSSIREYEQAERIIQGATIKTNDLVGMPPKLKPRMNPYEEKTYDIWTKEGYQAAYYKIMVIQTLANIPKIGNYNEPTKSGLENNFALNGKFMQKGVNPTDLRIYSVDRISGQYKAPCVNCENLYGDILHFVD